MGGVDAGGVRASGGVTVLPLPPALPPSLPLPLSLPVSGWPGLTDSGGVVPFPAPWLSGALLPEPPPPQADRHRVSRTAVADRTPGMREA